MNDTLKKLATILAGVAPTLATMLGGPFAGAAVAALEGAFGLSPGSGPDAITKVVQDGAMTPEIMAAVRAADQKHAEIMSQQGIDLAKFNTAHEESLEKIGADDRDSARKREMDTKDSTPAILAYAIIGGFFAVALVQIIGLLGWPEVSARLPPQGWVIIGNIGGYLASEAKSAAQYYFGSSSDSHRKTELLAASVPAPTKGA